MRKKLRGTLLYIDRAHAAKLPEGAFYIQDWIGCTVKDDTGRPVFCRISRKNGAADVHVVKLEREPVCSGLSGISFWCGISKTALSQWMRKGFAEVAVYDI